MRIESSKERCLYRSEMKVNLFESLNNDNKYKLENINSDNKFVDISYNLTIGFDRSIEWIFANNRAQ